MFVFVKEIMVKENMGLFVQNKSVREMATNFNKCSFGGIRGWGKKCIKGLLSH